MTAKVCGSIIGPIISIVHAEIILSISKLIEPHADENIGIHENKASVKHLAAEMWLSKFVDERSGRYVEYA
ncbi:hypothetical protein [Trinickia sp. Y13]|uniref:hypothetical protein n=1 Tax=Trinickia sp. Y13 TaxID=2917807 RepID=UPI0024055AAE|nr:hypothetical protein [Trinickia sp. Y13]MDG0026799.1 hypothetical protein [Trinickia sp. Y13]